MEVKKEYTAFVCRLYGCDRYYYDFSRDERTGKYKEIGGFAYIPYISKFDSLTDADAHLRMLKDSGDILSNHTYIVDETDELAMYSEIWKVMWDNNNEYKGIAFICRIPDSYYLGSKWCETLKSMGGTIEGEQPKFQKGDKVLVLGCECICHSLRYPAYEGEITDIMVELDDSGKKQYVYAFNNNPYAAKFIPSRHFHTEDEIISNGGKFYRGMHNGCRNTKLLSYKVGCRERKYVIY